MTRTWIWTLTASSWMLLFSQTSGCSSAPKETKPTAPPRSAPPPAGPEKIALTSAPVVFQDQQEPIVKRLDFKFDLPRPPNRARLVMRYIGVPGALSEDYKQGRFRHKVELNHSFLMDLNTYSESQEQVVEYTKWIPVGMFRRHNQLSFVAGDDDNREKTPRIDSWELRFAELQFEW
jgi:hypothetical protein